MSSILTSETILEVFSRLGEAIDDKHANESEHHDPIRLMVCGGAISVLLATRAATEDIDYCYPFLEDDPYMKISDTIDEITHTISVSAGLPYGFMNSDISMFMANEVWAQAFNKTWEQDIVICTSPCGKLQIYVADYGYQIASKLERITEDLNEEVQRLAREADEGRRIADISHPGVDHTPIISEMALDHVAAHFERVVGASSSIFA